jgi:hypothetical protein
LEKNPVSRNNILYLVIGALAVGVVVLGYQVLSGASEARTKH